MKEQLISFETAKLAKNKGFDEASRKGYILNDKIDSFAFNETRKNSTLNKDKHERNDFICVAPTQSLLQRWLRENHRINVESNYLPNIGKYRCLYKPMDLIPREKLREEGVVSLFNEMKKYYSNINHDSYEEALEEGLLSGLKLIKIQFKPQ